MTVGFAAALGAFAITGCQTNVPEDNQTHYGEAESDLQTTTVEDINVIAGEWSGTLEEASYAVTIEQDSGFIIVVDNSADTDINVEDQQPVTGDIKFKEADGDNNIYELLTTDTTYGTFTYNTTQSTDDPMDEVATLTINGDGGEVTIELVHRPGEQPNES